MLHFPYQSGHFSCFQFLVSVNTVIITMGALMSESNFILVAYMPDIQVVGLLVDLLLSLEEGGPS